MAISDFAPVLQNPNIPWGVPMEGISQIAKTPQSVLWGAQRGLYYEWWKWFDGRSLAEKDPGSTDPNAYIYPLGINPIEMICQKHATGLFGEVPDEADNMVEFYYRDADDKTTPATERLSSLVNQIWAENHGRGLQQQNALLSQFLGGCVFRVGYEPADLERPSKIRLSSLLPDFYMPIYDGSDPWNLIETYVMYYITSQEAKDRYGVVVELPSQNRALYVEHWTKDSYELQVGGQTPHLQIGFADLVTKGTNPYGSVPYIYIPHLRRTGGYYGWSHVPSLIGITKELNSRLADIGDNVRDNAQALYWLRNVAYSIKLRRIENAITAIDLGGAGPSGREPDMTRLDVPTSNSMSMDYAKELWEYIEKVGAVPGVAWGMDEGSQRSALTLSVRMWPFTSHIREERAQWTTGLQAVNRMIIKILLAKGEAGVTPDMLALKCRVKWHPIMPRERAEMVEEMVARKGVHLVSKRSAVQQLGSGQDLETEMSLIDQDIDDEAAVEKNMNPPTISAR